MKRTLNKIKSILKGSTANGKDLAAKLGVAEATVSLFMRGQREPGVGLIQKCIKAFPETKALWFQWLEGR